MRLGRRAQGDAEAAGDAETRRPYLLVEAARTASGKMPSALPFDFHCNFIASWDLRLAERVFEPRDARGDVQHWFFGEAQLRLETVQEVRWWPHAGLRLFLDRAPQAWTARQLHKPRSLPPPLDMDAMDTDWRLLTDTEKWRESKLEAVDLVTNESLEGGLARSLLRLSPLELHHKPRLGC